MNQPKHTSVLSVYQNVIKNAQYYREEAAKESPTRADVITRKERFEDIAHELYQVAAGLENTYAVNPIENVALIFDEVVASLDKGYMGSDGVVNGKPAFQIDFTHGKAKHRLYIISEPIKN